MTLADREALFVQLSKDVGTLMRGQKLSIARLARRADVSEQTVLNILKARPCHIETMLDVCQALGARLQIQVTPRSALGSPDRHGDSEPVEEAGSVYFVRCAQFIKIGYASNVDKRMKELSTSSPFELVLVGVVQASHSIERELHRRFAHLRVRGEWFKEEGDLAAFCAELAKRIA